VPGPVIETPEFTGAVRRGTRTRSGRPGAGYWVQHARYAIDAQLDPTRDRVSGRERVVYLNNSPDTLRRLAVHLRQNAFAAGNARRQAAPITGGVTLGRVLVDGRVVQPAATNNSVVPITDVATHTSTSEAGYTIDGTVLWIPLARPLLPHDSTRLELAWSYSPPPSPSDGRQGREDHHLYVMGYWYPEVAVYDDVHGWVADPYLLEAEFYMDPADYDVRVTVPRGWVVGATGALVNAGAVLSPATAARLPEARRTGAVTRVVEPGKTFQSLGSAASTVTWHFLAPGVRDFAWGTSDQWVWDATRALVADSARHAVDTVDINSFYRRSAPAAAWAIGGARFTRNAIEQLSKYLWPYPWPTMTSMEGVLDSGGMEYPMLTVMQPWADTLSLAGDLMHETGHMWFPMQAGSNETRHPWMDEGFTQFDVAQAMRALYGEPRSGGRPGDSEPGQRALYVDAARGGHDMTLMWPGDLYPQDWYFIMFYDKTAVALATLRSILGEETFHRAYREYGRRWVGKHPYPYDFFNTISDVSGRDLGWFWTTWFYEGWPLDQAIAAVETRGDSTAITIEDRGLAPMPVDLAVTRADGTTQRLTIPVDVWLTGARRYVAHLAAAPAVTKVVIDPDGLFPDINRANQAWPR
jgi:peptidase M1-like protein